MSARRMTFRRKLGLSLVILLLPLLAGEAFFHYQHYQDSRKDVLTTQMDAALDMASSVDAFVARTVAVQRTTGQALAKSHWHSEHTRKSYVRSVLAGSPSLLQLAYADASGRVTESTSGYLIGTSLGGKDYFEKIRNGANWVVSDLTASRMCGLCGFVVATGVRDTRGRLLGVVVSGVDERELAKMLGVALAPHAYAVMVDTRGRLTLKSNEPDIPFAGRDWRGYSFIPEALSGRRQYVDWFQFGRDPVSTGAVVPVGKLGWVAGVFIPREEFIGPFRRMVLADLGVTLGVLVATFVIASLVAKQMIRPVEDLSRSAEEIGKGNTGTRAPVAGTTELARLADTLNLMAESIEQRDEALWTALERERRIATALQRRMLPDVPTRIGDIELGTGYYPAREEAELGGDFYGVTSLGEQRVGLLIADVSGKGLSAAVHTAMVKYTLEGLAREDPSPASVLTRVNRVLGTRTDPEEQDTFVTVFFGVLDISSGLLRYANAGHPAPVRRTMLGETTDLGGPTGLPLGIDCSAGYEEKTITLANGDSILLYTDGVLEARREGELFGPERLVDLVSTDDRTPGQLVAAVYSAICDFAGGQLQDDVALLAVRMKPIRMVDWTI